MKLTEPQIREMFPPEKVRLGFLARPDIAGLPTDEQERRWDVHHGKLLEFYRVLAGLECAGVIEEGNEP